MSTPTLPWTWTDVLLCQDPGTLTDRVRMAHIEYLGQAQEAMSQARLCAEFLARLEQRPVGAMPPFPSPAQEQRPADSQAHRGSAEATAMSAGETSRDARPLKISSASQRLGPPLRARVLEAMGADPDCRWSAAGLAKHLGLESERPLRVLLDKMIAKDQVRRTAGPTQRAVRYTIGPEATTTT
jgi:hypothetical protein